MSLLDPVERSRRGAQQQSEITATVAREPRTLMEASWRDFVFAEVWTRPGLDRRSRFFIAISTAVCEGSSPDMVDSYVRGALKSGEIRLSELREAALHLAVYAGWPKGVAFDSAATRVAVELDLEDRGFPAIRDQPWDRQQRTAEGGANFASVMLFPSPPPDSPYIDAGILNFVFGEMWMRPGLDQRARRWVTLVGVANSSSTIPIRTHAYSAMKSGNATVQEMQEFVLQYAVHAGWPRASVMNSVVLEMGERVTKGLPYQ